GLATILPGKSNPMHYHPNCGEVLYVISGNDGGTVPRSNAISTCSLKCAFHGIIQLCKSNA
ncbi:MAG: hypothetical protein NT154_27580, partial [Verrucomicrobia bacterium]|nr:hypothetical protein [Verrucomicrobiota bacterium]